MHISNGVDVEKFRPRGVSLDPARGPFVVGFVGGSHPHHDIPTVLQAVKIARDKRIPLRLRIVGHAALVARWRELARRLNIDAVVDFVAPVPHDQVPAELRRMSVCVIAYLRQTIVQSDGVTAATKLWECWASRRPVIATDVPSSSSYTFHFNRCYLAVSPENPEEMAEAIELLYKDPDLAEELATNGYQYVADGHSWTDAARQIDHVLNRVLQDRP